MVAVILFTILAMSDEGSAETPVAISSQASQGIPSREVAVLMI